MVDLSSFTSVDTVLALLSIGIGIGIFLMQQRADSKINGIIRTQFRRQELEKKFFGTRLRSNLQLVKKNYTRLEQYLEDYLKDHSQVNMNKVKNYCIFQSNHMDEYVVPSLRSDLGRLIEFIDDSELVEKLSTNLDDFSTLFKDCSVESTLQESDSFLKEKMVLAHTQSTMIESLLSKLDMEIPKIE
jgi:hypothetical protein